MKHHALFSSKDKSKINTILLGALRVKANEYTFRGCNDAVFILLPFLI